MFDIDDTGKVELDDNTYMLIPELSDVYKHKKLGWKAITYIVCVCDYHSPYRQLLLADRIDAVCEDIYGTKNYPPLALDIVDRAMEKYKRLQYDPIYEQYNIYTEKLAEYNDYVRKMPIESDNAKMLQEVMLGQEKLTDYLLTTYWLLTDYLLITYWLLTDYIIDYMIDYIIDYIMDYY